MNPRKIGMGKFVSIPKSLKRERERERQKAIESIRERGEGEEAYLDLTMAEPWRSVKRGSGGRQYRDSHAGEYDLYWSNNSS